jgi:hypothetical protein
MGQGRTQHGRRLRAVGRTLAVVAALGVFYAAAAYAHGGHPNAGPAGSLHVSIPATLGLDADAEDVAAGDVIARAATLENRSKGALGAIALSVGISHSSALDHDRSGLRIRVDRCSTPWTAGTGPALRCAGRVTEVVGWRPLAASRSPWQLGSLPAKASEYLRVSLQLPADAASRLAGRSTTLEYRFTAQ